jgi:hypothetical protein
MRDFQEYKVDAKWPLKAYPAAAIGLARDAATSLLVGFMFPGEVHAWDG